jgi:hypothetical protein
MQRRVKATPASSAEPRRSKLEGSGTSRRKRWNEAKVI